MADRGTFRTRRPSGVTRQRVAGIGDIFLGAEDPKAPSRST